MTSQDLIEAFDTLAEAPEGVKRLREFVLQLAVRGKLVQQDPDDEPASVLLERIAQHRARLVKAKTIRKPKALPPVSEDEVPFEVPDGWAWERLGIVCHIEMGQSPKSKFYNQEGDGIPFFQGKADFGSRFPTARYWCVQPTKLAEPGDVLLSVRAPVGPTNVADVKCCIGRGLAAARPLAQMPTDFVLWTMRAFERDLEAMGTGTTFRAISKRNIEPFLVPLPPLAEQKRIVARVDELMGLLGTLEAKRNAREATRVALRDAALAALRDADTPEEIEAAWARIAGRMDDLFTDPADVEPLRQAVLQLAVRGRLVPQDPAGEPASALLARIAAERQQRWVAGERGKKKNATKDDEAILQHYKSPLPRLADNAHDLLPTGWSWSCVEAVTDPVRTVSYGILKPGPDVPGGVPYVKVKDIRRGRILTAGLRRTTEAIHSKYRRSELVPGDILVSIRGTVGKVAQVPEQIAGGNITQDSARLGLLDGVDPDYAMLTLRSPMMQGYFAAFSKGAAVQGLNIGDLRPAPFPVPPVIEQRRIAARVGQFMELLEKLTQHLSKKKAAHDAFAAAAVHHLDA